MSESASNSRRSFIRNISLASVVLLGGKLNALSGEDVFRLRKKVKLRFVVLSDSHYGQPKTLFDEMMQTVTTEINHFHQANPVDFCVINGDLIHNEKTFLPRFKEKADRLAVPYFVTRGNHDMVSDEEWKTVWNTPLNHDAVVKGSALLFGDTSNEKGTYLSPDLVWLEKKLKDYKKNKQVFLFLHIPQAKWTANGIDTPAFFELVKQYPNIKAVFHGHEHDKDGVHMHENIPYMFDSHVGGSWGTDYRGFRVVELMNDRSLVTYMMNPTVKLLEEIY